VKQGGYALLLFIPILLMATISFSAIRPMFDSQHVHHLQKLSDSRRQLIAYSASYLESYKPTGAGPGHLPCPDSDRSPDEYQVQLGLRGDGPNPPCGKHSIAIGKLPRHISHGKHRYAFHLEDRHTIWYAVDTRFINNPINRVVNPDTVGRINLVEELPAAAVLFMAREGASIWAQPSGVIISSLREALQGERTAGKLELFERSVSQYVLITPAALVDAVTQRVALWMYAHFRTPALFNCASNKQCVYLPIRACDISLQAKIQLLMLSNNHMIECSGTPADVRLAAQALGDSRLDGVFLRRHWFYRNDWWRFVDVQLESDCIVGLGDCYAAVEAGDTDQPIVLRVLAK